MAGIVPQPPPARQPRARLARRHGLGFNRPMVEIVGNGTAPRGAARQAADPWAPALRHLRRDPVLRRVIRAQGPCLLRPVPREPYEALVRAIAHQQVHGRAAEAILGRFLALYGGAEFPPPAAVLATPPEALRSCGFSFAKIAAIHDIAAKAVAGIVPGRAEAAGLDDATLITRLVAIRGVGRWTVEMLLIFTLGRPDVLPVDDFGVREGWRAAAGLEAQPTPRALAGIGEAWSPWRSVAAWYLWRAADAAKRSAAAPG